APQKRLGARRADERRRDTAVCDRRSVDAVAGHGQTDCGGEGGDVEVFAARDFVELERVADDADADAGDDLVRLQIEFAVAEVEAVDGNSAGAAVHLQHGAGNEEIRQRVADGRTVGDVADER